MIGLTLTHSTYVPAPLRGSNDEGYNEILGLLLEDEEFEGETNSNGDSKWIRLLIANGAEKWSLSHINKHDFQCGQEEGAICSLSGQEGKQKSCGFSQLVTHSLSCTTTDGMRWEDVNFRPCDIASDAVTAC